jgi:hypothetical protein
VAAAAGGAALALSCVAVVWGAAPSGGRSELQSVGPAAAVAAAQAAQSQVKLLPDPTILLNFTRTGRFCGFAPPNASPPPVFVLPPTDGCPVEVQFSLFQQHHRPAVVLHPATESV